MLELYWAEACELDPPSEGVGYGCLEANMAMSCVDRSAMWGVRCSRLCPTSVSLSRSLRAHVHMLGCSSDARRDGRWMTPAGRLAGGCGESDSRCQVKRRRGAVVDVVQERRVERDHEQRHSTIGGARRLAAMLQACRGEGRSTHRQ